MCLLHHLHQACIIIIAPVCMLEAEPQVHLITHNPHSTLCVQALSKQGCEREAEGRLAKQKREGHRERPNRIQMNSNT